MASWMPVNWWKGALVWLSSVTPLGWIAIATTLLLGGIVWYHYRRGKDKGIHKDFHLH